MMEGVRSLRQYSCPCRVRSELGFRQRGYICSKVQCTGITEAKGTRGADEDLEEQIIIAKMSIY